MQDSADQSRQQVPVKLVLPRWLVQGLIAFFVFCFVALAALAVYSVYMNKQAKNIFPPEEQRRLEEEQRKQLDNSRRKVEELLHPSPTPAPVRRTR